MAVGHLQSDHVEENRHLHPLQKHHHLMSADLEMLLPCNLPKNVTNLKNLRRINDVNHLDDIYGYGSPSASRSVSPQPSTSQAAAVPRNQRDNEAESRVRQAYYRLIRTREFFRSNNRLIAFNYEIGPEEETGSGLAEYIRRIFLRARIPLDRSYHLQIRLSSILEADSLDGEDERVYRFHYASTNTNCLSGNVASQTQRGLERILDRLVGVSWTDLVYNCSQSVLYDTSSTTLVCCASAELLFYPISS